MTVSEPYVISSLGHGVQNHCHGGTCPVSTSASSTQAQSMPSNPFSQSPNMVGWLVFCQSTVLILSCLLQVERYKSAVLLHVLLSCSWAIWVSGWRVQSVSRVLPLTMYIESQERRDQEAPYFLSQFTLSLWFSKLPVIDCINEAVIHLPEYRWYNLQGITT